ncbi:glycerol-3-phosphate 1-O-acyltransferase PlsY [Enterovirga aerilata]|uniref:Glycerol-3-phosphate acyltransferase n=1 Tax=Enterovirga aerilata TaxID=2730920 RepID=A0A849I7F2_9HYPH|nr:glycerol-3-phosphate 1-O-acyltransferase PlsY [Enterovirga sp. DB1703]NNM73308.1 glycerol-3-phosphate 1-O-acyltransferase PlsY [Enterovirga sp. DB1703]
MTALSWGAIGAGLLLGYLLGSVPFGLLLTRAAGLGDVRAIGSGNIGATNVLRTGRKGLAAATLLFDALKGTVAILVALRLLGPEAALAAAAGAFLGHVFPVWLGFKGGKGVATFIGCLLALDWRVALIFAAVWLGVAFVSRYSSLAALVASILTPFGLWYFGDAPTALAMAGLVVVLWFKHRPNIERLLAGTEGRIGQKG